MHTLLDHGTQQPNIALNLVQPPLCDLEFLFLFFVRACKALVLFRCDDGSIVNVTDDGLDVFVFRILFQILEFELPQVGLQKVVKKTRLDHAVCAYYLISYFHSNYGWVF